MTIRRNFVTRLPFQFSLATVIVQTMGGVLGLPWMLCLNMCVSCTPSRGAGGPYLPPPTGAHGDGGIGCGIYRLPVRHQAHPT